MRTPTPWFVYHNKQDDEYYLTEKDGDFDTRLVLVLPGGDPRTDKDDAAFIVRAANSFDALVAACEPLLADAFQQWHFGPEEGECCENSHMNTLGHHLPGCPRIAAWKRLRAALAQAKE